MSARIRMKLTLAVAFAAIAALPASASAETLFEHVDETSPQSTPSQDFPTSSNDLDAMAADDFTVPAGQTWTLESALVRGNAIGTATTDQWNVAVFADAGGTPGASVFTGTLTAPGFDDPLIPLGSVPTLASGTYWLGVQAIMADGPSLADAHRWFWAENDELAGNKAVWRNPGGGFTASCPNFVTRSTCTPSHPAPDQSFRLSGTRTVTAAPGDSAACTAAKAKLDKAKAKLKKAKEKAAGAEGDAKKKAKAKVKKAKDAVKKAQAEVTAQC